MQTNAQPQSAVILPFPTRQVALAARNRAVDRSSASTRVCSEAFDSWYHQAAIDEETTKKS